MDLELDLFSDIKDKSLGAISNVVARVSVQALNSQPVDHEDAVKHMALSETAGKVTSSTPPVIIVAKDTPMEAWVVVGFVFSLHPEYGGETFLWPI